MGGLAQGLAGMLRKLCRALPLELVAGLRLQPFPALALTSFSMLPLEPSPELRVQPFPARLGASFWTPPLEFSPGRLQPFSAPLKSFPAQLLELYPARRR